MLYRLFSIQQHISTFLEDFFFKRSCLKYIYYVCVCVCVEDMQVVKSVFMCR